MKNSLHNSLLGGAMVWTVITTLFTWLPLVRILGRPEGYHWQVLGLSGEGFQGAWWVFIPFVFYSVLLLFTAERGPRNVFHPLLILWHLFVLGLILVAITLDGNDAMIQGQGLNWSFPLWILVIPALLSSVAAIIWVTLDRQLTEKAIPDWSRSNTKRLTISILLLLVALVLFRLGTNYNWVTALAIVCTIAHWILLSWAFSADKIQHSHS